MIIYSIIDRHYRGQWHNTCPLKSNIHEKLSKYGNVVLYDINE